MATKITNRLPQLIADIQRRGAKSMTQALILGASEASVMTPIDTSNLINSQYRGVEIDGAKIVGTFGYTAEYALAVHDPENKQVFRRQTAEKSFLKNGFDRAEPNIRSVISGAIKA